MRYNSYLKRIIKKKNFIVRDFFKRTRCWMFKLKKKLNTQPRVHLKKSLRMRILL